MKQKYYFKDDLDDSIAVKNNRVIHDSNLTQDSSIHLILQWRVILWLSFKMTVMTPSSTMKTNIKFSMGLWASGPPCHGPKSHIRRIFN